MTKNLNFIQGASRKSPNEAAQRGQALTETLLVIPAFFILLSATCALFHILGEVYVDTVTAAGLETSLALFTPEEQAALSVNASPPFGATCTPNAKKTERAVESTRGAKNLVTCAQATPDLPVPFTSFLAPSSPPAYLRKQPVQSVFGAPESGPLAFAKRRWLAPESQQHPQQKTFNRRFAEPLPLTLPLQSGTGPAPGGTRFTSFTTKEQANFNLHCLMDPGQRQCSVFTGTNPTRLSTKPAPLAAFQRRAAKSRLAQLALCAAETCSNSLCARGLAAAISTEQVSTKDPPGWCPAVEKGVALIASGMAALVRARAQALLLSEMCPWFALSSTSEEGRNALARNAAGACTRAHLQKKSGR